MDDADSDFDEDYGDQDTTDIDAALVPTATGNSSLCLVSNYRLITIWPDSECQKLQPAYEEP